MRMLQTWRYPSASWGDEGIEKSWGTVLKPRASTLTPLLLFISVGLVP